MVWNKTPERVELEVIKVIKETDMLAQEIAKLFSVSKWLIEEIARRNLTKEERKEIWSKRAKRSKLGELNPMFGKTGEKHHNSVKLSRTNGYKTVFKPDWFTGKSDGNRIYEHIFIYCVTRGLSEIPKGYVIHHKDENIDNNEPWNLELLSISEHVKLHWRQRKEQRLSRDGVGGSTPEAQAN